MQRPKYPIGIQTFSEIIGNGYIYVDKTKYVYDLVTRGKYYFLSRPRRFGKSLFLSTLEAFFSGKKELFAGLYVAGMEWDWVEYPVFHMMLNGQDYTSVDRLDETLNFHISTWEKAYGLPADNTYTTPSVRFARLIEAAHSHTGRQVVILVDEYDLPLLQNIEQEKEEVHRAIREHLQAFYSVIKSQDRHIRFAMLTGISKFSKVSVFSGLNNIKDISLDVRANAICGISESELHGGDFAVGMAQLAEACGMTLEQTADKLRREYDGYHFAKSGEGIYNPFSLLNTFDMLDFSHYWIESGTPSFLIRLLQNRDWNLAEVSGATCRELDLRGSERYVSNPIPLLFQCGYLTIKGYNREFDEYTLDYPNDEVAEGLTNDLLKAVSCNQDAGAFISKFVKAVRGGDAETFMHGLQSLMSDVPYDLIVNKERHYENMMYLVMKMMGFYVTTEYRTSDGRIDMLIQTDRYTYVIEFKLNGTAEDALAQIHDKGYVLPFHTDGRRIILIGAAFSPATRRLDSWWIERG